MSIATQLKDPAPQSDDELLRFVSIQLTDKYITAELSDGRVVSVPLWWSWRLEQASSQERQNYELIGVGTTAYWPAIAEHLSVQGFLSGTPAPRPSSAQ